jgi:transposase
MEKARKGLRAELTLKQKRGLMHDRFVLLKRERDLNDEERLNLDGWTKNYPALGEAYRLKDFYGIYEAETPEDAMRRYEAWHRGISTEIRPYFADLIRAFTNWQPFILNYFEHPVTNAYTESLNSLIRVMNRLGRGYSFEARGPRFCSPRASTATNRSGHGSSVSARRSRSKWGMDYRTMPSGMGCR